MSPRDLQPSDGATRRCLDDNEVLEHARGLNSRAARAAVERHIDRCADCREAVSDLVRTFSAGPSAPLSDEPTLPAAAPASWLEPPMRLGRYLVLHRIGAGGMGVVHAGYDPELDRRVALKLLAPDLAQGPEGQARLLQEAQAMAKVSHPQVVAVHDAGVHQGRVWLAMEYVDGATLTAWLRARPRGWRELLAVFVAAGEGLAAAHAAGLVHRDFKPDNVMIDASGRVRVLDFGLSRIEPRDPQDSVAAARVASPTTGLTRTGSLLGTPRYMAPEQWRGELADARSDEFSFCVALWEALHGEPPFAGDTHDELAAAVCAGRLRTPPPGARVPRWLRQVVERGLAREPALRFDSMRGLLAALQRDPTRRVRRRIALAAAAAAVAVAALTFQGVRAQRAATCAAEAAGIAAIWTPAVRDDLRRAAAASGDEVVVRNIDRTIELGDAYAAAWAQQRARSCAQTTLDGTLDAATRGRLDACLDDGRAGLEVLVGEAARAEPRMLQRLQAALGGLRAPDRCADPVVLRRYPPEAVGATPEAAALRRIVARIGMLVFIGAFAEADVALRAADSAAASQSPALQALVDMAAADLAYHRGDMPIARARLVAAHDRAGGAGLDEIAAEAAIFLVDVDGFYLAQPEDGFGWLRLAEMWLTRMGIGPDDDRRGSLLVTHGKLLKATGDLAGAQRLLERAIDVLGASHPDLGGLLLELGVIHALAGDPAAAYARSEQARAVIEAARGPDHPQVADALYNLALIRADVADHARAVAYLERTRNIYAATHGPDHPAVAETWARIGASEHARGAYSAALAAFQRARDIAARPPGAAPEVLALALAGLGQAELELHGPSAARPTLERALAPGDALANDPAVRGAAQFALARALASADPHDPRVGELVLAARDSFVAAAPTTRTQLAALAPWLARRRRADGSVAARRSSVDERAVATARGAEP